MTHEPSSRDTDETLALVTAVVINWNGKKDTLECLTSLSQQTYSNLRIIVVDNHSTDDSPEAVTDQFPSVELIINPEDFGFGRGINVGIRHAIAAGADYVFALNNDTFLDPSCIENLMKHSKEGYGLLAPMIYYAQQPNIIWSMGGTTNTWNLEKRSSWDGHPDKGNWPDIIEQDFVTCCAVLISRTTIEQIGMFDERFFMYYEDADLSLRVRRHGLRIMLVPQAKMWHKVALSSGGVETPSERYWMARSSVRFFAKYARGIQVPIVIFWRTLSAIRTTVRLVCTHKWKALQSYWRGLIAGVKDVRKIDFRLPRA